MKYLGFGLSLAVAACSAPTPSAQRGATDILERLIEQHGRENVETAEIPRADGSPGFVRVRIRQHGVSEKFAVTADGKYRTVADAYSLMMHEHRARYGSLSYDAVQRLTSESPSSVATIEFVAWVVPGRVHAVAAEVADVVPRVSTTPPFFTARATLRRIQELARHPDVYRIDVEGPGSSSFSAAYANDGPGDYSRSVTSLAANGSYGAGINVGILEGFEGRCVLDEAHKAFAGSASMGINVQYLATPATCTASSQCACTGGGLVAASKCVNGQCQAGPKTGGFSHTNAVASRITGWAGTGPKHASDVSLFVSNDTPIDDINALASAYQDFVDFDVTIVNQSFAPPQRWSPKHHLMDWFQYNRRLLLVQGQPNGPIEGSPQSFGDVTSCYALNSLCVGGANASGTYGDYTDDTLFATPSLNPVLSGAPGAGATFLDAERPDVISEAVNARVASLVSTSDWVPATGNSFAAPTVTGLAALITRKCIDRGFTPTPEQLRSMIKTSAAVAHNLTPTSDPAYPYGGWAQRTGGSMRRDGQSGAGIADGETLDAFCGESEGCTSGCGRTEAGDLLELSWTGVPAGLSSASSDGNVNVRRNMDAGTVPGPLKAGSLQIANIGGLGKLRSGDRVRTTLAFTTCPDPTNAQSSARISPARDYDLILYDAATDTALALSESFDDTNEGFDVLLPGTNDEFEDVVLAAIRPASGTPCKNDAGEDFEPFAISTIYWKQP